MERERKRINEINNNFVRDNSETYNKDLHRSDFTMNFRKEKSVLSNHSSKFLPPITAQGKENLRSKANLLRLESVEHRKTSVDRSEIVDGRSRNEADEMRESVTERGFQRYSTIDAKRDDLLDKQRAKERRDKKNAFYISSFDGAHLSMPMYKDKYTTEKNINVIHESMKGVHAEQSSLIWQFGLR